MIWTKRIIVILVLAVVAYNSVYFAKLDAHRASQTSRDFNAEMYASTFWDKLQPDLSKATDFSDLKKLLSDKDQKILSKRGSANIDERTNTLFVQDTGGRLEEARRLKIGRASCRERVYVLV